MADSTWIADVEAADIEAGDELTLDTESETEGFDGEATVVAASEPNSNYWVEIESPGDNVFYVIPDTEKGAILYQGTDMTATGVLTDRREIATVLGIKQVA